MKFKQFHRAKVERAFCSTISSLHFTCPTVMEFLITVAKITRRSKIVYNDVKNLFANITVHRCQARIKLDRYSEIAFLMRGHNHNPELEIDHDCKISGNPKPTGYIKLIYNILQLLLELISQMMFK